MLDDRGERIGEFFGWNDKKRSSLGEVREITVGLRAADVGVYQGVVHEHESEVVKTGLYSGYAARGIDEFLEYVFSVEIDFWGGGFFEDLDSISAAITDRLEYGERSRYFTDVERELFWISDDVILF